MKKERKKERKREKKEKKKALENGGIKDKKHSHKRRNEDERTQYDQKAGGDRKKRKHGTEHFEKSNLTEEHGKPVNSLNSTDSTLNSSKKQKQTLPPDGGQNSGECVHFYSLTGAGCSLVGFLHFTWSLIRVIQILLINVKQALFGSGCLCKGTKIQKCYPAGNSLALPQ